MPENDVRTVQYSRLYAVARSPPARPAPARLDRDQGTAGNGR